MSNGLQNDPYIRKLAEAIYGAQHPVPPKVKLRIATKRTKHSERFAERIQKNADIADSLIEVIKELNRKQDTVDQVDRLIDIARDLLENNAKLREQVGEAIEDIPASG